MDKPTNAPACFAAASIFSHDSEVCRGCCAFDACSVASLETLQAIRGIVNVSDLLKRHERAKNAARKAIKEADKKAETELPPGNSMPPVIGSAARKTQVAQIKFDTSADDERIIATLPLKSQKIAVSLCKTGLLNRIKKGLQEGRNALAETGPGWLRVAIDRLIAGGFARAELREAMRVELDWEDSSAAPHVSMAVALFVAFGIAQDNEGRLVLIPATA